MKNIQKIFTLSLFLCLLCNILFAQADWETDYIRKLEDRRTEGKNSFYNAVSSSTYFFTVGTPLTYLITGVIIKDKALMKQALYITESIGIATIVTLSTKAIVKRERPAVADTSFKAVNNDFEYSFPSGHTSAAFSLATSMAIINHKWYVVVPAFSWATLVGYSRLYLGVHYPTDIIAGAIVGSGSAWLSYKLNKWMHQSKTTKVRNTPPM
jgi:membrane-associated phospholipid phosphatase